MSDYRSTFRLLRDVMGDGPTTGQLFAGDLELFTLELPWKDNAPGVSCIPLGTYECVYLWSNRFQRPMPRLLEVPGRYGVLFHAGNTEADTEGCVLVGSAPGPGETITGSKIAVGEFIDWLVGRLGSGPVGCEITLAGG